jgi:hypothetical protein|tara:strand:- start:1028 stop:1243 length:216 start_codon:yes stop_codon:yes gene_type:complete
MDKRIIYKNDDGSISIIIPADCGLTVEQIAQKDVPTGLSYKIVNVSDISSDRTFRNAWTIDNSELTDGVGA